MPNYVNNANLLVSDSYYALNMTPLQRYAGVYMSQPNYAVITQLSDRLSEPQKVNARKFEYSTYGNTNISVEALTRTASGSNLVLTFSDPEFQQVRVGDMVRSNNNGAQARVVSSAPGEITITPWAASDGTAATSFVAADFAAGTNVNVMFDSSHDKESRGKSSLTRVPESDFNYVGVTRESLYLSREDLSTATYELYDGKYWAMAQEDLMMRDFARSKEYKTVMSTRNQTGGYTTSEGLYWNIKRKGNVHKQTTAQLSQSLLHEYIESLIVSTGAPVTELTVLHGARFMRDFQEVIGDKYIQYAGTSNTLGGASVVGINAMEYKFMGVSLKFVHYPMFDDLQGPLNEISDLTGKGKWSSTALFLNTNMAETTQGVLSPFQAMYFGPQPVLYRYAAGMVDFENSNPTNIIRSGYVFAANDRDGCSIEVLCDDGYQWNGAERNGLIELVS